jgi:hypothetical protein
MTDILSTNDSLFTKNDMIMTDNGYYASMPLLYSGGGKKANSSDKVSDNYKNLGFPALYLYTINDTCYKHNDNVQQNDIMSNDIMSDDNVLQNDNEIMPDELYNKLISLAEMKPVINKKYTRNKKNINKQNVNVNKKGKKTRRNKNL